MKKIIYKVIPICLYVCIGMSIPLLLGNTKVGDKELPESKVAALAVVPEIPSEVHFADETIHLSRADLRERMDREITAFTYSHQLTLLMIKRANRYFPIVEPILKECGVELLGTTGESIERAEDREMFKEDAISRCVTGLTPYRPYLITAPIKSCAAYTLPRRIRRSYCA